MSTIIVITPPPDPRKAKEDTTVSAAELLRKDIETLREAGFNVDIYIPE